MEYALAGTDVVFYSQLCCSFDFSGFMLSVEHEHVDEILDPFCLPLGTAKSLQKKAQGLRAAFPPLPDGACTVEGHGPLLDQFEVVIKIKTPFVVAVCSCVSGQLFGPGKNIDPIRVKQYSYPKARIWARNGITIFIYHHSGVLVSATVACLYVAK